MSVRAYHTTALGSSYYGAGATMVRGGVSDDIRAARTRTLYAVRPYDMGMVALV